MGILSDVEQAIDRQTAAQRNASNHLLKVLSGATGAIDELAPLVDVAADIAKSLECICRLLKSALGAPPNPGALSFELTGENGMITGNVKLPDFSALSTEDQEEISSGKLIVARGSGGTEEISAPKEATTIPLSGAQDDTAHLEFMYIDNAGNPSKVPATLDISFPDSVAPVDPAALGWEVTGETPDPV